MNNELYILSGKKSVSKLEPTKYENEADLQEIIAENPELLRRPSDSEDLNFFLIRREQPVYDKGSDTTYFLDHFFVDTTGIPVLVEVKRSSDTRIHREVVAQMLDYSANISRTDMGSIEEVLRREENQVIIKDLDVLLENIKKNLQEERFKLVFVADKIPPSLETLILFLDRQAPNLDCYGVALDLYVSENNKLISKSVVSSNAPDPRKARSSVEVKVWDEPTMRERITGVSGEIAACVMDKILVLCNSLNLNISWGRGPQYASFAPIMNSLAFFRVQTVIRKTLVDFCPARMESAMGGRVSSDEIREKLIQLAGSENEYMDTHSEKYVTFDIHFFEEDAHMQEFEALIEQWVRESN